MLELAAMSGDYAPEDRTQLRFRADELSQRDLFDPRPGHPDDLTAAVGSSRTPGGRRAPAAAADTAAGFGAAFEVPEEELRQIRALLARHFAEKATSEMDRFVEVKGLTPEDLEPWAHEHVRT